MIQKELKHIPLSILLPSNIALIVALPVVATRFSKKNLRRRRVRVHKKRWRNISIKEIIFRLKEKYFVLIEMKFD